MTWPRSFGPTGPTVMERRALLLRDGCTLDVIIRPDSKSAGAASAPEVLYKTAALIDTGASKVCIDYRIAQKLQLREIDQTTLHVVGGKIEAHLFLGELEVPGVDYRELVEFVAPKVGQLRYEALLGRSFLTNFMVTFDGPAGQVNFMRRTPELLQPYDEG